MMKPQSRHLTEYRMTQRASATLTATRNASRRFTGLISSSLSSERLPSKLQISPRNNETVTLPYISPKTYRGTRLNHLSVQAPNATKHPLISHFSPSCSLIRIPRFQYIIFPPSTQSLPQISYQTHRSISTVKMGQKKIEAYFDSCMLPHINKRATIHPT